MTPSEFCHEFHQTDLRILENCLKITSGCQHVYNLAADMGGMGFIGMSLVQLLCIYDSYASFQFPTNLFCFTTTP